MIGIQLYTVRKLMTDESSADAVIASLREIGYGAAQLAGSLETVALTAGACIRQGMQVLGILVNIDLCESEQARLFEIARACGATDLGISSSAASEEDVKGLVPRVNAFARTAQAEGFTFSYHNHSNEFIRTAGGKTVMELLLEGFDAQAVRLMPDTYWLQHGGVDVRDFLARNGARVGLLHLKDMKRAADGPTFAEIGVGNLNFPGILETAAQIGVEHVIVEQDKCDGDPLDSARISYEYLKDLWK